MDLSSRPLRSSRRHHPEDPRHPVVVELLPAQYRGDAGAGRTRDFIGSIFAKEWSERHHPALFLAGLATFGVLFAVYAASLKVAELSVVTFGWIVFLQVGIVLLDTLHYGVRLPPGKWVAVGGLIALQAYLIIAPNAEAGGGPDDASPATD